MIVHRLAGEGRFFPVEHKPPIEQTDSEYPFVLSTGRTLCHYNSATIRDGQSVQPRDLTFERDFAPPDTSGRLRRSSPATSFDRF